MKAIELYRFVNDNSMEWHRIKNGSVMEVFLFIDMIDINEFYKLLTPAIFEDGGIACVLKDGYFAIEMSELCEYYDIELNDVFPGKSWDSD